MIKNCILFSFSGLTNDKLRLEPNWVTDSSLEDCQMNATGIFKPKIKSLMQLAKNEKLEFIKETEDFYEFNTLCEFKVPQLLAAGISPYTEVRYKIWLRKQSLTVVSFDAGRKLSSIGITLLSNALTHDPSLINNVKFYKENFIKLIDWILSDNRSGQLKRINLKEVEHNHLKFKQVILTADHLQNSKLFKDLSTTAKGIADITFLSPPLNASGRVLTCRLNYWGSLTIYTPNLLDSEITELLINIENILL